MTTSDPLHVTGVCLEHHETQTTLSGTVGGERLFWTTDSRETIVPRGEPFIAAVLVSAMTTGRDLHLPGTAPVDAEFLRSTGELQTIFSRWFPGLRRIAVHAEHIAPRERTEGRFTGYSGGIDSSYSVLRLAPQLDGAVFFDGIEIGASSPALIRQVVETLGRTLSARDLPLVTVQTNAKLVGRALGGRWQHFIGGALASVPHLLGAADYWIAGSNAWENVHPYGTHPFTDPLWSSGQVRIHHHGAEALRIDKTRALGADGPDLLGALRVCFQGRDYNCGVCHKCLQTSAGLRALQLLSAAMPPLADPRLLRRLSVEHDGDLVDWTEILLPDLPARDPVLTRELHRLIRRYQWRQSLRRLDELVSGGIGRRLAARRSGTKPR